MSLYTLTVDLLMKVGAFERDSGKAARLFGRDMQQMQDAARRTGIVVGTTIAAGVTAASAAVFAWSREVAMASREMDNFANLSKSSSVEFQRLAVGASTAGISTEKLADQLKDFNEKVGEFRDTGGGGMKDFFDNIAPKIGITKDAFSGLSGPQGLQLYYNSLEKAGLSQEQMSFYLESMASDATALIPLLRNGGEGFKRWGDAAQAAGAIIDGKTSKAMADLRDLTAEADLAFKGIKVQVAEGALPAMQDFANLVSDPTFKDGLTSITSGVIGATTGILGLASAAGDAYSSLQELMTLQIGGFGNALGGEQLAAQRRELAAVNEELASRQSASGVAGSMVARAATAPARIFGGQGIAGSTDAELRRRAAKLREQIDFNENIFGDPAKMRVYMSDTDAMPDSFLKPKAYQSGTTPAAKGKGKNSRGAADSMEQYRLEAERAAAAMNGPVSEALVKHQQRVEELNTKLAAGNIKLADHGVLLGESATGYAKVAAEAEKAARGPQELLDSMAQEVELLGMSGQARELYRRQLQAEGDMRDVIARAQEAGVSFTQVEIDALMEKARAFAGLSISMEEAQRAAEDWQRVAMSAAGGVADTFSGLFDGSIKDSEDFFDSLKDVFKRGLADIARTSIQQKWLDPLQKQLEQVLSGRGFSASGSNFGQLGNLFGSTAGAASTVGNAGTWASSLASSGSMMGFGSNVGAFAGGGSGAAAGASSAAAAVPIIGWIVAGMMENARLFDEGWDIGNGESWAGKIATLGAVSHADDMFRKLGMNNKTASILSGSSIHAKLFGRKAPQITGQGITGDYGFGGFTGQSYADVKAKGGLFRSDKKWTQYGAVDSTIDRTFDMAARAVKQATLGLGAQLGVDMTQQLAGVKVSLGKIQLSADSAEAQRQLEGYLSQMQERLYTEAVKAAGFGGQLDGLFESEDVFNALGVSIKLAVGDAESLGRALNSLEIGKVNKAVDYFQNLADVAGTDLAAQIEKVTGFLTSYSSLMADVSTQLMTGDLSAYQSQALTIERTYRQQVKAANDYAKALGLSGARAEDLAKIEALRATNMGKLQAQIDADKKSFLGQLSISDLSPLTDQQKLDESMKQLQEAVAGGNTSAAQAAAQAALGFGKDLYASGKDYNALYGQVTSMIGGMKLGDLDLEDGTSMGALADAIEALPDSFSRGIFEAAAGLNKEQTQTNAALQEQNKLLAEQNQYLQQIVQATQSSANSASRERLAALNQR